MTRCGNLIVLLQLLSAFAENHNYNDVPKIKTTKPVFCRDRSGYLPLPLFNVTSCTMCFFYLFQEKGPFVLSASGLSLTSKEEPVLKVIPYLGNKTSLDVVCSRMSQTNCAKWTGCCTDASICCYDNVRSSEEELDGSCPPVWDGFSCVSGAAAGKDVSVTCPWYIPHTDTGVESAHRKCTSNGTWWKDELGHEWTDYSTCIHIDIEFYRIVQIISISLNSISACLLSGAIAIFLAFRQLRIQQRIKLHINLCVSLLLCSVTFILWESLVYYNRLVNDEGESLLYAHQGYCTALNVAARLLRTTTFFWMLCEGFYLHWLLKRAFKPIKKMIAFYIFGWGVPLVVVATYTGVRLGVVGDNHCWISNAGGIEWIIFAPTIACIGVNLIFLFLILRVLLTQLQVHPNEPNNYRRATKAMFILIPLFGLHQFFIIYNPEVGCKGYWVFQIATAVVVNSQGCLVSLIFCFLNGEAITNIKSAWAKWRRKSLTSRRQVTRTSSNSLFTLYNYSQRSALDLNGQSRSCCVNEMCDISETLSDISEQSVELEVLEISTNNNQDRTTTADYCDGGACNDEYKGIFV